MSAAKQCDSHHHRWADVPFICTKDSALTFWGKVKHIFIYFFATHAQCIARMLGNLLSLGTQGVYYFKITVDSHLCSLHWNLAVLFLEVLHWWCLWDNLVTTGLALVWLAKDTGRLHSSPLLGDIISRLSMSKGLSRGNPAAGCPMSVRELKMSLNVTSS